MIFSFLLLWSRAFCQLLAVQVCFKGFLMTWHLVGFPRGSRQRGRERERKGEIRMEARVFLKAKLEVTFHHFCHILLVLSKSQSLAHIQWEKIIDGHHYQEGGLVMYLRACIPQYSPCQSLLSNRVQHSKKCSSSFHHIIVLSLSLYCSLQAFAFCIYKIPTNCCFKYIQHFT